MYIALYFLHIFSTRTGIPHSNGWKSWYCTLENRTCTCTLQVWFQIQRFINFFIKANSSVYTPLVCMIYVLIEYSTWYITCPKYKCRCSWSWNQVTCGFLRVQLLEIQTWRTTDSRHTHTPLHQTHADKLRSDTADTANQTCLENRFRISKHLSNF